MDKLPAELLDAVFAHFDVSRTSGEFNRGPFQLSGDRESLISCSLVCRHWTSLAQSHLFRDVFYKLGEDSYDDEPHKTTLSKIRTGFEAIHTFYDTHRDLAAYVGVLGIATAPVVHPDCLLPPLQTHHHESALFCSLLSIMPRLERLHLQDFVLKSPIRSHGHPVFALKTLKIYCLVQNTSFSDILYLLSLFTEINLLKLIFSASNDISPEPSYSTASDLAIHSLDFQSTSTACGTICRYLASSRSASTLHSLTLGSLLPSDIPQLNALIDVIWPNLTRLSLSFDAAPPVERAQPQLNLARLLSLQSLELSIWACTQTWRDIWGILATLSAADNRALRDATLLMRQYGRFSMEDAWMVVPHALLNTTYATLCALHKQGSFERFTYREQGIGLRVSHEADMFPDGMRLYLHPAT